MDNKTQVLNEYAYNLRQSDYGKNYNYTKESYAKTFNNILQEKNENKKIAKLKGFQRKLSNLLSAVEKYLTNEDYPSALMCMDAKFTKNWLQAFLAPAMLNNINQYNRMRNEKNREEAKSYSIKFKNLLGEYINKSKKELSKLNESYIENKYEIDLLTETINWDSTSAASHYNNCEKAFASAFRKAGDDLDTLYKLKSKFSGLLIDVEHYEKEEEYDKIFNKMVNCSGSIFAIVGNSFSNIANSIKAINNPSESLVKNDNEDNSLQIAKDYTNRFIDLLNHYNDEINEKINNIKNSKMSEEYFDSDYDNILQEGWFSSNSKYSEKEFLIDAKKAISILKAEKIKTVKSLSEFSAEEKVGIDKIFIPNNSNKTKRVLKTIDNVLIVYYITEDKNVDKPYAYFYKNKNDGVSFKFLNAYLKKAQKLNKKK